MRVPCICQGHSTALPLLTRQRGLGALRTSVGNVLRERTSGQTARLTAAFRPVHHTCSLVLSVLVLSVLFIFVVLLLLCPPLLAPAFNSPSHGLGSAVVGRSSVLSQLTGSSVLAPSRRLAPCTACRPLALRGLLSAIAQTPAAAAATRRPRKRRRTSRRVQAPEPRLRSQRLRLSRRPRSSRQRLRPYQCRPRLVWIISWASATVCLSSPLRWALSSAQ